MKHTDKKSTVLWILTLLYMALIYFLSSLHTVHIPGSFEYMDKVIHALAYAPLAYLLYRALKGSGMQRYVILAAFALTVIYGSSDELHQYFVPGRTPDLWDLAADSAGAFIGCVSASVRLRQRSLTV